MIIPNIEKVKINIGNILLYLVKYLAVKIISPNLVNSLGCIPKEPIPNQLQLPLRTVPIPGINTKISNNMHINIIIFALE